MTTRMNAGVLGVLVVLAGAVVTVAQTLTDCQALSNREVQAAHEQYEAALRACNKERACLQEAYDRWITASNNAQQTAARCAATQPAQTRPTPQSTQTPPQLKELPPKPAPIELPDNPDFCDQLRTRLTTAAVNQYNNVVRTCQSPECIKAALDEWSQADHDAEQKYNACRAKEPLKGTALENSLSGGVYNPGYGQVLPAMTGQVAYQGTTIYVTIAKGHIVGQGIEGPVQILSSPPKFSRAEGMIQTADTFVITKLWNMQRQPVNPVNPIMVPIHPQK